MVIRTTPLSPQSRELYIRLAEEKLASVLTRLSTVSCRSLYHRSMSQRTWRYAEVGDSAFLDQWLDRVRRADHCL
jgi:hypothetical protein